MKAIWDNTRGLDLLSSMPEVDSSRGFGVIGHSLGGHNAIFTAVFDERISVLVSSCGFDSFADYYDGAERNWYFGKGWCQIRYMPRLSDYRGTLDTIPFDFPDLLAALAPRKVFINAPRQDSNFRWQSVARCADHARSVYQIHHATGNLIVRHPDCEHDFPQEIREEALRRDHFRAATEVVQKGHQDGGTSLNKRFLESIRAGSANKVCAKECVVKRLCFCPSNSERLSERLSDRSVAGSCPRPRSQPIPRVSTEATEFRAGQLLGVLVKHC